MNDVKLGDVVHYYQKNHTYPAIVTCVHSPSCVNLHVFGDGTYGPPDDRMPTSVLMGTDADEWSWPPVLSVDDALENAHKAVNTLQDAVNEEADECDESSAS